MPSVASGGKLRRGLELGLCPLGSAVTFGESLETFLMLLSLCFPICEIKIQSPPPTMMLAAEHGALGLT